FVQLPRSPTASLRGPSPWPSASTPGAPSPSTSSSPTMASARRPTAGPRARARPMTHPCPQPDDVAYIGVGSNLGDRLGNLASAARALAAGHVDGVRLARVSPVFE